MTTTLTRKNPRIKEQREVDKTVGFGAWNRVDMHHFFVETPKNKNEDISIYENFGFEGGRITESIECRVKLSRKLWNLVRHDVGVDFNTRLKEKKLKTGKWEIGKVKLDRLLGKELCVLCWATEQATDKECPVIIQKWMALRPEERWWLYSKVAQEYASHDAEKRGWRKAIYFALGKG